MIQSTSLSSGAGRAQALQKTPAASASVSNPVDTDRFSTSGIDQLRAALKSTPEIRPEVVARGQALAADPAYPSQAIIRDVSAKIVDSPDLTVDPAES